MINDSKRCAEGTGGPYSKFPSRVDIKETLTGWPDVADQNSDMSTATIYAGFDGEDTMHDRVTPPCKLNPEWPRNWGDLDFDNNCLKSRDGSYNLCCSEQTTTSDVVINPYVPQE